MDKDGRKTERGQPFYDTFIGEILALPPQGNGQERLVRVTDVELPLRGLTQHPGDLLPLIHGLQLLVRPRGGSMRAPLVRVLVRLLQERGVRIVGGHPRLHGKSGPAPKAWKSRGSKASCWETAGAVV